MSGAPVHPRKEGWLLKKAVRTASKDSWKKRWVVVDAAAKTLSYAKYEAGKPVLILGMDDSSSASNCSEHKKQRFEFKVVTREFIFFACAASDDERDVWVSYINGALGKGGGSAAATSGGAGAAAPAVPPPPAAPAAGAAATPGAASGGTAAAAALPGPPAAGGAAAGGAGAGAAASLPPPPTVGAGTKITSLASLVKRTEDRVAKLMAVGANDTGQLGTGQQNASGSAVMEQVTALKLKQAPIAVAAGLRFAAAISASDQLFTWGGGGAGQLAGDPAMTKSLRPFMVPAFRSRRVLAIACGGSHALAVVAPSGAGGDASGALTLGPLPAGSAVHHGAVGGQLFVWGSSSVGALGLGGDQLTTYAPTELRLPGAPEGALVTYIAAGVVSSAAVIGGRQLYLWGDAGYGRLGLGPAYKEKKSHPLPTPTPLNLTTPAGEALLPGTVGLGGSFSLFLGRTAMAPPGSPSILLTCGMIGVDVAVIEDAPGTKERGSAPAVSGAVSVSVRKPKLKPGDESTHSDVMPVPVPTAAFDTRPIVLSVSAGVTHYVAIVRDNGANRKSTHLTAAVLAAAQKREAVAEAVAAVTGSSAAAMAAVPPPPAQPRGAVYTAGYGLLGHPPPAGVKVRTHYYLSVEPQAVGGALAEEDVIEVAAGYYSTFARNTSGELLAYGSNEFGGLNMGRFIDVFMPTTCTEPTDAHYEQIAAGPDFVMALQFPGLLGDARTRQLAKNAFSKWRKKARARASMADTGDGELTSMLQEIASDEDLGLGALAGSDFGSIISSLLRTAEAAQAEEEAQEAAAAAGIPDAAPGTGGAAPAEAADGAAAGGAGAGAAAAAVGDGPAPAGDAGAAAGDAAAGGAAAGGAGAAPGGIALPPPPPPGGAASGAIGAFAAIATEAKRKSTRSSGPGVKLEEEEAWE